MDKKATPILAKASPSGGSSTEPYVCPDCGKTRHVYNAKTLAALKEGKDIMSGKKKGKWHTFPPEMTQEEVKEKIKDILGV